MKSLLHRLHTVVLRVLLFVGVAQLVVPCVGSASSEQTAAARGVSAGARSVRASAATVQTQHDEQREHSEHATDAQLSSAETCAEIDDLEAGRRRLHVRSAVPSHARGKVFWEESVRIRVEDRRNCRPPNRNG
jgi:hypothetical protein